MKKKKTDAKKELLKEAYYLKNKLEDSKRLQGMFWIMGAGILLFSIIVTASGLIIMEAGGISQVFITGVWGDVIGGILFFTFAFKETKTEKRIGLIKNDIRLIKKLRNKQ